MSDEKGLFSGRNVGFALAGALGVLLVVAVLVGIQAVRTAITNFRYSTICPDYFSFQHAYVVDSDGIGLDSVAVTMRDNSNMNLLYRTFTDSAGRFELFNDFNSFALFNAPATYHIYVSAGGTHDTVLYKFQRHRVCHFTKIDGPDTIRITPKPAELVLRLTSARRVSVSDLCDFLPWETVPLGPQPPKALRGMQNWNEVSYGVLRVGGAKLLVSVVRGPTADSTRALAVRSAQGTAISPRAAFYVIDRDLDGNLDDERLAPWRIGGGTEPGECGHRPCQAEENLIIGGKAYPLDLTLDGAHTENPRLHYRTLSALQGQVVIGDRRIQALLWDRLAAGFADLRTVALAFDTDGDGAIQCDEGAAELCESAVRRVFLDSISFLIDTITADGSEIRCRSVRREDGRTAAGVGAPVRDIRTSYSAPLSLWQECGEHEFVLVYFFEGSSAHQMQSPRVRVLVELMEQYLGSTRLIGVNRKAVGAPHYDDPVIVENRGWHGPVVAALHNHRDQEVVCIDSLADIVCRAEPGRAAVEAVWQAVQPSQVDRMVGKYEHKLGTALRLGTAQYD